jgi:hypothetical protein
MRNAINSYALQEKVAGLFVVRASGLHSFEQAGRLHHNFKTAGTSLSFCRTPESAGVTGVTPAPRARFHFQTGTRGGVGIRGVVPTSVRVSNRQSAIRILLQSLPKSAKVCHSGPFDPLWSCYRLPRSARPQPQ